MQENIEDENMTTAFGRLDRRLRDAIAEAGYAAPTPIQEKAIPPLLDGRDLIGCAQTGTGKTAAFLLPIIDALLRSGAKAEPCHPHALVLSPTRELTAQICANFALYAKHTKMRYACVFGGVSATGQIRSLKRGADVVIATPGRLIDLMTQGAVYLDKVERFVLDEADRMLDMGFLPDIQRILSKLPAKRQSMFFSATLPPDVMKLAGDLVHDPVQVTISPEAPAVEAIDQRLMCAEKAAKDSLLAWLLTNHSEWDRVMAFVRTRHNAERVLKRLLRKRISAATIHSDKTQNQRMRALEGFKKGDVRVLVATDIASRGIDVPEVDLVVQLDLPLEPELYVHRIGRTARAGKGGTAIAFVAPEERVLVKPVERFIGRSIPIDREQPFHVEIGGRDKDALPLAPWIRMRKKRVQALEKLTYAKPGKSLHFGKAAKSANKGGGRPAKRSTKGRRQPDFGQKPPWS